MSYKTLKEAEDYYYGNIAQTNDEEGKLESWLAMQDIEETRDKSIMEEFGEIEEMAKDLAVEAGIVYPSSVFENDAEEDIEKLAVKEAEENL